MARFDVTAVGEGLLRYSVPAGVRLEQASQLAVHVGGTEANVLSLLARLGWRTGWVSALPENPLGRLVGSTLQVAGIDMTAVHWSPDHRLGTYYVEFAVPPRPAQVYYDRKESCFSHLSIAQIDWDYLLDTRLLHLSGLTIPLSPAVRAILLEALTRAQVKNIPISFDMNYRARLWTPEEAAAAVSPFIKQCTMLFYPARDAHLLHGFSTREDVLLQQLAELSGAKYIVASLGADGLAGWDGRQVYREPVRETVVLDRIGAGDALVAGVLHGWLQEDFAQGLRYGALAAALALSQIGDQVVTSAAELEMLLNSDASGDITR
jgi:2-dehydro-3-deoxygluconokinase